MQKQRPSPPRQTVYVVKQDGHAGPLRAGWVINWLILATGLLIAAALMLSGSKGDTENAGAVAFGFIGATLGFFLYTCGGLIVLSMAIVAMSKGAVGRAFLMLLGTVFMIAGAIAAVIGAAAFREAKAHQALANQKAAAEAKEAAMRAVNEAKEAALRKASREQVSGILADAEKEAGQFPNPEGKARIFARLDRLHPSDVAGVRHLVEKTFNDAEWRTWTDRKGRKLEAKFVSAAKDSAGLLVGTFEKRDGEQFTYRLGDLSEQDVALLRRLIP